METGIHTHQPESLSLRAADGYPLTAVLFPSSGAEQGRIIVAGATGVPQRFYRPFAEYASAHGFTTLTLDYRGVGLSRPASLRGFDMNYLDWAYFDLTAAVDEFASEGVPLFMVGHSFGGHAFGLLPNFQLVAGLYTFGTGAGWHGWMPPLERLRVLFLWRLAGPLVVGLRGYLAWSSFGLGEDLPLGVYRDWKRWCRFPNYFFDDPALSAEVSKLFERVRTPITAANSLDDLWAMPASRDAFVSGYRNADLTRLDIDPETWGLGPIGHMGYFRRGREPLWKDVLSWFRQLNSGSQPNIQEECRGTLI